MAGLSESDRKRMQQFANTPVYDRDPEMLVPSADDDRDEAELTRDAARQPHDSH